jgi:hypothetical protein
MVCGIVLVIVGKRKTERNRQRLSRLLSVVAHLSKRQAPAPAGTQLQFYPPAFNTAKVFAAFAVKIKKHAAFGWLC